MVTDLVRHAENAGPIVRQQSATDARLAILRPRLGSAAWVFRPRVTKRDQLRALPPKPTR